MTSRTKGHRPPVRTADRQVPGWLPTTAMVLSIAGLAASAYLTFEHYTEGKTFACPEGAVVNCAVVTTSAWSTFLGIPVALLGLVFFIPLIVLSLRRFFVADTRTWDLVRVLWTLVGLGFALYLVWAELFHIKAICLWCTIVHVITFVLLVVLLLGQAMIEPPNRVRHKDRLD